MGTGSEENKFSKPMFWILDKITNEPGNESSVVALSAFTRIKKSIFYEKFGREKLKELHMGGYRICVTEVLKAKRK